MASSWWPVDAGLRAGCGAPARPTRPACSEGRSRRTTADWDLFRVGSALGAARAPDMWPCGQRSLASIRHAAARTQHASGELRPAAHARHTRGAALHQSGGMALSEQSGGGSAPPLGTTRGATRASERVFEMGRRWLVSCWHDQTEELLDRPERRRMGAAVAAAGPSVGRQRATRANRAAGRGRCDLLRAPHRLPGAAPPRRLPALEYGGWLLRAGATMAPGSRVAMCCVGRCAWAWGANPSPARRLWTVSRPKPRNTGRARLRCREAGEGAQAAHPGRHRRLAASSRGLARGHSGLRRRRGPVLGQPRGQPTAGAGVGRQCLRAERLPTWTAEACGCQLEIVSRPTEAHGLVGVPRQWAVERTVVWLGGVAACRRTTAGRDDRGLDIRGDDTPFAAQAHPRGRVKYLPKQALSNVQGVHRHVPAQGRWRGG